MKTGGFMDYGDFLNVIAERLRDELGDNYVVQVTSSRDSQELMVLEKPAMEGFTLNAEKAFEDYRNGESMTSLMNSLLDTVDRSLREMPKFDRRALEDYNTLLDNIRIKMVSKAGHEEMLKNAPHIDVLDMAAVFRVVFGTEPQFASAVVTNRMLNRFNVSPEKFTKDALEAGEKNSPARIMNLGQVLNEMDVPSGPSHDTKLVFAGNDDKIWGASVIIYPSFMDQASKVMGGDFFLLPSSIHEVLLLPDDGTMDGDRLKKMVMTVNATEVEPEDVLTNNAYHYDAKERVFDTVDHYKEVQKKHSVLKELGESRKAAVRENRMVFPPSRSSQQPPVL